MPDWIGWLVRLYFKPGFPGSNWFKFRNVSGRSNMQNKHVKPSGPSPWVSGFTTNERWHQCTILITTVGHICYCLTLGMRHYCRYWPTYPPMEVRLPHELNVYQVGLCVDCFLWLNTCWQCNPSDDLPSISLFVTCADFMGYFWMFVCAKEHLSVV